MSMQVVILCGGKGTRIRDVSDDLPKPMIPIGPFPILKHIMEIYSQHGLHEFVLCLGHMGWRIKEYFLNIRAATSDVIVDLSGRSDTTFLDQIALPWRITMAETGLEAMTGCRIKRVQKYLGNDPFLLTYGDGVGNINVTDLLAFHRSHGRLATITSVHPRSRFGEMTVSGDVVTSFDEKPQAKSGWINGGFFVFEPGVFDYLSADETCVLEREPLQALAKDGQLMTYVHRGFWMPMDTIREYTILNQLWHGGSAPWTTPDSGDG